MGESRWLLVFYLLLVGVVAGAAQYTLQARIEAVDDEMLQSDRFAANGAVRDLTREIADTIRDIRFLRNMSALRIEVDEDSASHRQRVVDNLAYFSSTHESYEQLRWLDENGLERVRIDRKNGITFAVAQVELQDKSTRPYFTQTMALPEGALYVSPLDLNIENGRIEEPLNPTLRVATPLFDSTGARRGIVIANFDGSQLLQRVHDNGATDDDHLELFDSKGYWLVSHDPRLEWGFMFNRPDTIGSCFPASWRRIAATPRGQMSDRDGMWSWQTVSAAEALRQAGVDAAGGGGSITPSWIVVAHRSARELQAAHADIRGPVLTAAGGLLVLLTALTALLARSIGARRRAERARDEQEQFRVILEANLSGLAAVDANGQVTFANPALEAMFAYPPGGLLGKPISALIPGQLDELLPTARQGMAAGKRQSRLALNGIRKDGGSFPVEVAVSPMSYKGKALALIAAVDLSDQMRSAAELAASEERYRSLVAALSEGVLAVGLDGNVLTCNRAAETILRMTEEQMKSRAGGLTEWSPVREDGTPFPVSELPVARTLSTGRACRGVIVGDVTPGGVVAWLMVNSEPLFDPRTGKLIAAVASFSDITSRLDAEKALRRHQEQLEQLVAERTTELVARETELRIAEERFRSFVERAPIAMVVAREGRLEYGNEQFEQLFGSIEAGGSPLEDFWNRVFPDSDYRRWAQGNWSAAQDEVMLSGRAMPAREYRMGCADGQMRFLEVSGVLLDAGFLVTFVDVTDRREHAQRLSELADFNAKVIAGSTQGMLAYRADGQCVMANEAAAHLLGGTVDKLLAQNFNLNPVWKKQGFLEMAQNALRSGRTEHGERQYLSSFGKPAWIAFDLVPFTREGDPHILMQFSDVSAFRQAEATLREGKELAERASQAKGQFLANMSHEIRTPMNAIIGLVQILERSGLTADQGTQVRKIGVASRTLMGILNDILDFSKVEAGQLNIETIPFSLASVLETLSTIMSSSAGDKDLDLLIIEPEPIGGLLIGDPLRLKQILINLTSNAIKFTEHGRVEVSYKVVERQDDRLRIRFSVKDTGIGISPSQQSNIFEAFVQADSSTTRRFGGSGLGLSICKRLVELMGGRIGVHSKPGLGSEFWFEIPLGHERTAPPADSSWKHLSLLVVDDNEVARDALSVTARSLGWSVETAESGREAVDRVRRQKAERRPGYDVIVMDWQMPELDGLAASRIIHDDLGINKPPVVIVVSAYGRDSVARSADASYADAVLTKPVTGSMLHDAVVEAVSGHSVSKAQTKVQGTIAPGQRLSGVKILIVDDSVMNREIAQWMLELEGAEVSLAGNGREAVDRLSSSPSAFDIVLMDVQMPVMDGLEATKTIRHALRLRDLPIMALTAGVLSEERDRVFAAGMNDFLSKPYDVEKMMAKILQWTRRPGAATPASSAPHSQPITHPFPSVDGIDVAEVHARLGGDPILFLSLLRRFLTDATDTFERAREEFSRGNGLAAAQQLHKLRGGAANLSAKEVARLAGVLEQRLRNQQLSDPEGNFVKLESALSLMKLSASPWVEVSEENESGKPAPLDEGALRQLADELSQRRISAIDLFKRLRAGLSNRHGEVATAALAEAIEKLRFEQAHQLLRSLMTEN